MTRQQYRMTRTREWIVENHHAFSCLELRIVCVMATNLMGGYPGEEHGDFDYQELHDSVMEWLPENNDVSRFHECMTKLLQDKHIVEVSP